MKSNGASLIPAAMPMPIPFHRFESGLVRSQTTSSMSSGSIWPRYRARTTGSVHSASALTASAAPIRPAPRRPIAPSVSQAVSGIAARLAMVMIQRSVKNGTSEPPAKTSAANGV